MAHSQNGFGLLSP